VIVPFSSLYTFKNFTDLTEQESNEVLHGRNDLEVRRWMTSDRVISDDEHYHFMKGLQGNPNIFYVSGLGALPESIRLMSWLQVLGSVVFGSQPMHANGCWP
jgi:exonuclease V gamma subunit